MSDVLLWLHSHPLIEASLWLLLLALAALIADLLGRRLLLRWITALTQRSENHWDDELLAQRFFHRVAHILPPLIVQAGLPFVPHLAAPLLALMSSAAAVVTILMLALTASAFLSAVNAIYQRTEGAHRRPIKGYVQLIKIILVVVVSILLIAQISGRSPLIVFSGLGAMTAVLLLIFKDTVLSFVASIQLIANDSVRVGDWIEMPQSAVDGTVIDLALHTVTVQNFDKTIVQIPTWKLVSESFKNWRGMSDSGTRRIKRAIVLDISSVYFLTDAQLSELSTLSLIGPYLDSKRQELQQANRRDTPVVNHRRMTNVGTFRAYVVEYLKAHPKIHQDMTLMVRQLDSTPDGLPLELYCFTRTSEWLAYESIRSDLFDHLFAILPVFGLRAYQRPSGHDVVRGLTAASPSPASEGAISVK